MATITGLTAERMLEIEGNTVVSGEIVGDHLILTKFDGTTVDSGAFPPGPQGPMGPAGGLIPGEIRIWPGDELPPAVDWGKWAWADGAVYVVATYPKAAENIATQWRTFAGASDPGPANFRVPDLRGLTPAGLDAMPGGSRANRVTRSVAIVIAGKTGEELHVISVPEMAVHGHPLVDPGHGHPGSSATVGGGTVGAFPIGGANYGFSNQPVVSVAPNITGITIGNAGGGQGHETMQPTVFVPYIVKMDD
jgi:microcystin-dependent protein